jgi:hypothetical protein
MGRQHFFYLLLKPLICFIMLTVGTVAVATATVDKMQVTTVIALIHHCSKGTISAGNDIPDGFLMKLRHSIPIKRHIFRSIHLEDFLNSTHDNTPCMTLETLSLEST